MGFPTFFCSASSGCLALSFPMLLAWPLFVFLP